jgi:cyclopropane fatty-acyl-phospholipid synthase-like methyltransferase
MQWLRRLHFELSYLLGTTPWDSGVSPPELIAFLDSHPSGKALDIGCGTGTNAITMAGRGWDVLGIDFSRRAIRAARRKAGLAGASARFERANVSQLGQMAGEFDFALDIGCYHSLSLAQQITYAQDLGRLLRPGATFLVYGFTGFETEPASTWLSEASLHARFEDFFGLRSYVPGTDRSRPSAWATLIRRN